MKRGKFKIGDKVTVVKRMYGHGFKLGSTIIIKLVDNTSPTYYAKLKDAEYWVDGSELSPPPLKKLKVV